MSDINQAVLVGRLTSDPEKRSTNSGKTVVSFSIACNRRGRDAGADFINCVAWEKTAQIIADYAKKGSQLGVVGRIQTRNYETKDGKTVKATEVVVNEVMLLGSKPKTENAGPVFVEYGEGSDEDLPF